MKNSMKLVIVALALVVFATLAAACGPTTPADTTTTVAPVTTTEPPATGTTTAPVTTTVPVEPPAKIDLSTGITFEDNVVDFKGSAFGVSTYRASGYNSDYLSVSYSFKDSTGATLAEAPINVGVYQKIVTFAFKDAAYAETHILPEPMTATFTVNAVEAPTLTFEGVDAENKLFGYYYDDCDYKVTVSELPYGLEVSYAMFMIKDSAGNAITPEEVPANTLTGIPSATESGVYTLTATFTDLYGNYVAGTYEPMTAELTVKACTNQVKRFTPDVDGVLDAAYASSAHFATTLDTTLNPEEYCIFSKVTAGDHGEYDADATIYYLWDDDYVYVCIVVNDSTNYARTDEYVAQPDAWLNDALEFYYYFGGYEKPIPPTNKPLYPTYSVVTTDSHGRGEQSTAAAAETIPSGKDLTFENAASISAVPAQRSAYFNDILCAVTYDTVAVGEEYTYVVELAIPAKTESLKNGQTGEPDPVTGETIYKVAGDPLTAGEFAYIAFQVNDLVGQPEGVTMPTGDKYPNLHTTGSYAYGPGWADYEDAFYPYVKAYSNRGSLDHYTIIQFSNELAVAE